LETFQLKRAELSPPQNEPLKNTVPITKFAKNKEEKADIRGWDTP
jgi:hypothetical protein